mmetsp:Transcript_6112/g.15867  ORF Transcript_6112/g.15867 Transcript_6112/m.15867 type:complete len:206 (+) Transcript_6112:300-917(+)
MRRVNTVVARRRREQSGRQRRHVGAALPPAQLVVRRVPLKPALPIFVGIPVLSHPRRTSKQLVEASHVKQRNLAHRRIEAFREVREHVAHHQTTVAATLDANASATCKLLHNDVVAHSLHVLVSLDALTLQRSLMPRWSKFTTSSDARLDERASATKPSDANACAVASLHGDLKPSVAVDEARWLVGGISSSGSRSTLECLPLAN